MSVLLCEDDENLGMLLREYLQAKGFEAELCPDGDAGYKAFLKGKFDICILDVMMPMLDGYQVLSTIRKFETERNFKPEERTKVIMTTALNEEVNVKKAMEIGCDAYVGKPVNVERFAMLLSKMGFEKIKD